VGHRFLGVDQDDGDVSILESSEPYDSSSIIESSDEDGSSCLMESSDGEGLGPIMEASEGSGLCSIIELSGLGVVEAFWLSHPARPPTVSRAAHRATIVDFAAGNIRAPRV
jgi:hypothetical protein